MRPSLVLALALALVLPAGCIGGGNAPTTTKEDVKPAAVAAAPTANASEAANVTVTTVKAVLVEYKGSSPTGFCTFGLPSNTCQFQDPGKEASHQVKYDAQPTHLAVGITYGAQQPGFAFYATICVSKDSDPAHAACNDYKTSASPIVLEKDLKDLPKGAAVIISAGSVTATPTPNGAIVLGPGDFSVKGFLTVPGP